MDQNTVDDQLIEDGRRLVEALIAAGHDVSVAFWARPLDSDDWYFYIATSLFDQRGPIESYQQVHLELKRTSNNWIKPLQIRLIGRDDALACAALKVIAPLVPGSVFVDSSPKPYPGMTLYGGRVLGGLEIIGAIIYPPFKAKVPS